MREKILATLREWNILIGFCFVLGGVIFIAWISSMPPESATVAPTSAGSQPPASQLASKDAAHAAPQSSPAERAPVDSARPSRPPAASEPAAHQMPGHGLAQPSSAPATSVNPANAPPAQPLAPSASSAPAAHQMHGQPPAQSSSAPAPVVVAANPPAQSVTPTSPTPAGATAVDGDAATGRQVYRKCQACHSLEAGKNTLGPSLAGIIGKKSGEAPNYNYSAAMKAANLVWDAATLDAYLLDPQKLVPQNKMPFPGLKTANERKDVIAYFGCGHVSGGRAGCCATRAACGRGAGATVCPGCTACSCLPTGNPLHIAYGHCGRTDGLSWRRRHHRRTGQSNPFGRGGTNGTDHPDQRRRCRARHRLPGAGCKIVTYFWPRRKHVHRIPR